MPNVNRQTIYQMGNVVNDVVKQATGRDPVQAISMDYVTVEQNTLMGIETQSGSVVTFITDRSVPLLTLEAQIVAQQDLHGQDYPYPAGSGKNICPPELEQGGFDENGLNDDGSGIYTTRIRTVGYIPVIEGQTIVVSASGSADYYTISGYDADDFETARIQSSSWIGLGNPVTIDNGVSYIRIAFRKSAGSNISTSDIYDVMCEYGTTATTYMPYSNICPITGFTGCNISVSGGDNPERIYPVDWESVAGTVYGGVLDAKNGKLTITYGVVDLGTLTWATRTYGSNNGFVAVRQIPGIPVAGSTGKGDAICSRYPIVTNGSLANAGADNMMAVGEYWQTGCNIYVLDSAYTTAADFKEAMTGVQLVYKLAEPVEYDVVEVDINTLVGENVMSANTGDISLSYYVYHDLL